jgi:polysaccharide biosynthesis protein PelD
MRQQGRHEPTGVTGGAGEPASGVGPLVVTGVPAADVGARARASRDPVVADYGLQVLPPLTAVLELAAIVAALMFIDWVWPALDINSLQPSPYWLPVLLLSLQYGTASGSLAVVVAIAAYFTFVTLPEQGVGENEFAYRLRTLSQPILWISAAVLLGQFRMVQIAAKREMLRRVEELEGQTRTLADFANRLRGRCDTLERDIVTRGAPSSAPLLDSLAALHQGAATPAELERCFEAAFPGAAVSLFVRHGVSLNRLVSTHWPKNAPWLTTLPLDHPLVALVAGAQRSLSVLHPADDASLAGQGVAAVPVVDAKTGRTLGMIKVEACDASLVTEKLVGQLQVLASAISHHLDDANLVRTQALAAPVPLRGPQRVTTTSPDPAKIVIAELVRPKVGN